VAIGLAGELRRGALGDDRAVAQDAQPVGEVLGLVHVVGGEEDRLPELAEAFDHVPRLPPRLRVEARGRLVEEHEVADDAERNVDPALLAPDSDPMRASRFWARPTRVIVSSTGRGFA
jgi:hypothetical protein